MWLPTVPTRAQPSSSAAPSTARRSSATSLRSPRSWARVARAGVESGRAPRRWPRRPSWPPWRWSSSRHAVLRAVPWWPPSRRAPCSSPWPWPGAACVAGARARRPVTARHPPVRRRAARLRLAAGGGEPVEHEEAGAGALERLRRLGVAEAVDVGAVLAQVHDERGEVGVGGDQREGVGALGVQDLDGVDGQGDVAGVLALARVELLHGADRVLVQHLLPRLQAGLGPVAVGAAHVGLAEPRQLAEDDVDPRGRRVVGVDEEGDLRRFVHGRTLCPRAAAPARRHPRA